MRRYRFFVCLVALFAISSWAWSASLDEARRLRREGSVQAALAEIEKILGSDAPDADKAEALDLLGDIAVDQGYLPMAKQAWSRLVADYPDFVESTDAQTKLSLVSALLGAESVGQEEDLQVAAEAVAVAVEEPEMEPEKAPAPPAPAEPTPTVAAPAPPATAADDMGLVFVAVRGRPHDAAQEASDRIVEFLRERGVDAASATGGIPVVQESDLVLPLLLQKGQENKASSVLVLTAEFANMQKMGLKCYLPEGAELWKLKVSGGTGTTGREWTKTGINYRLVERFEQKLEPRIGGPGLPVTLE